MPVELLLPRVKVPVLPMPSYVKLAMAFGVGAGASLFDKSRYRSHGAITTATWAAGLHGYCLDFNAANPDYVEIPAAHTQLDFTSEDFSIIARIYVDDHTEDRDIFMRGLFNADGYEFVVRIGGQVDFYTYQNLAFQRSRTGAAALAINTWYTVGISRTGDSVRIYRNGIDITVTVGVHIDPLTSARNALIGIYDELLPKPFDGRIEFLRIFGGIALTTSEHLAWHNALA